MGSNNINKKITRQNNKIPKKNDERYKILQPNSKFKQQWDNSHVIQDNIYTRRKMEYKKMTRSSGNKMRQQFQV